MPLVSLTREGQQQRRRRVLISGSTGMRKTTSLLSFPRPLWVVNSPGEKGYDVLHEAPDLHVDIWEVDNPAKPELSQQILNKVRERTVEILSGKHGDVQTFAFEGLHKLYGYALNAITEGAYFHGEEFEPRLYGRATEFVLDYLALVNHSTVPIAVFTTWSAPEGDRPKRPGERAGDVPSHEFPDLPGKLAKRIMGEFSVVCAAVLKLPAPGRPLEGMWQLKPEGDVWGCAVKCDPELAQKLPTFIKNDYRELERILNGS